MEIVIKGILILVITGVVFFIVNRIQAYFDKIEYRETEDKQIIYRLDKKKPWWNK